MKKSNEAPYVCLWQRAIRDSSLASTTKLTALTMSTYMDRDGMNCFPATKTIASGTGLSERAVCKHIGVLKSVGWVEVILRKRSGKGWKQHKYIPKIPITSSIQHQGNCGLSVDSRSVPKEQVTDSHPTGTDPDANGTDSDDKMVLTGGQSKVPGNISSKVTLQGGGQSPPCANPISDQFQLTQNRIDFALQESGKPIDWIEREFKKFKAYYLANGYRSLDWDAKWQKWIFDSPNFERKDVRTTNKRETLTYRIARKYGNNRTSS